MSRTTEKGRIGRLSFSRIFGKHERKTTGNLVVCLTQVDGYADPMVYSFKSFPIRKLIHHSSSRLKPKEEFVWREIKDASEGCTPNYFAMSLIHTGGLVYAVGGVKADDDERHLYEPGRLPREFSCISLSTPLENSRAEIKCPMHGAKYFPLIEEIDGRIYVLSGPRPSYGSPDIIDIGFEVYYPSEDRWADLPIPPFLKKGSYSNRFRGFYSYVVIGSRLCVSTGEYACAFDTVQWEWEACELFSDFPIQPPERYVRHLDGCGPPFLFEKKAILYKDNILLCIMSAFHPPVCAYQICDEKVVHMPLILDGIPNGVPVDLVDLGNDYFAVMLFEYETEGQAEDMTIVTFKLLSERGGDGALSCALDCKNSCSLLRVQTDYIDLYQIHWPDRYVPMFGETDYDPGRYISHISFDEQLDALGRAVDAGKIRYIGLSNETPYGVMKFLEIAQKEPHYPRIVSLQNAYNLLCRNFDFGMAECCHHERYPFVLNVCMICTTELSLTYTGKTPSIH